VTFFIRTAYKSGASGGNAGRLARTGSGRRPVPGV